MIPPSGLKPEFEETMWLPPVKSAWHQRWRRGWRLVVALLVLAGAVYLPLRGLKDYRSLKIWRARSLAQEAMTHRDDPKQAVELFQKAAVHAPNDTVVLRLLADYTEAREDPMALYALRKLVSNGQPTPEDRERLCRLAFDWGHPELADATILSQWAEADPATLELRPLDFSARWLANRGQRSEAEKRLRSALEKAGAGREKPLLQFVLSKLLLASPAAQSATDATLDESLRLLSEAIRATVPPMPMRAEAARLIATTVTREDWHRSVHPELVDFVRKTFEEETAATQKPDPVAALRIRIHRLEFEIALAPARKQSLAKELLDSVAAAEDRQRLMVAKWLNVNALPRMALVVCDATAGQDVREEWFTERLVALFQLQDWGRMEALLAAPQQPLSAVTKALYLFRIQLQKPAAPEVLNQVRKAISQASDKSEVRDTLHAASVLEKLGEYETASELFSSVQNHPQGGLAARLGIIRCLDPQLERSGELVQALEGLVRLWPQSEEARGSLAYLRLLDKSTIPEDLALAKEFNRKFPNFLSYRVTAALAWLREKNPSEALKLLQAEALPWPSVLPGWRAVYAAVLAANGKNDEARQIVATFTSQDLRPGERRLLEDFLIAPP